MKEPTVDIYGNKHCPECNAELPLMFDGPGCDKCGWDGSPQKAMEEFLAKASEYIRKWVS